ncbi:MAG: LpxL/LpxP family Kdo(2)-lipid IV(A) lauroyl/palmitoleoyl acyltransferase [Marinagarivorans sp.]|nr:LpxL/LpxP family Kdo(2)-lipid IV(A) lauroyl/palmitoleoyl acyltransferase [Marinagarivorans sp.]
MSRPVFRIALLAPKYWPTWMGFVSWWLITQLLPYRVQMFLGAKIGKLFGRMAVRRTAIAKRNLELCFPHLSPREQTDLLHRHLESIGMGMFELGIAWFWSRKRLAGLVTYEGLECLQQAEREGQGVLLMGMHFTHLDCGGIFSAMAHSIDASYRQHANPVYDWIQRSARERFNTDNIVIERRDVRTMVRQLKKGRAMWYAPDQDYGAAHSVFVPFFGVEAATLTATTQLARLGKAKIIPFTCLRKPSGGYHYKVSPALENFPSGDETQDAERINHIVEQSVMLAPEQYLWVHRRFKTRPPGKPDIYAEVGIAKGKRQ